MNDNPKDASKDENHEDSEHIPEFTKQGLQTAIDCLKKGNAGDRNGVKAEDTKESDDKTKEMTTEIFNEVNKQENMTPEAWRKVVIKRDSKKEMTREGFDANFKLKVTW